MKLTVVIKHAIGGTCKQTVKLKTKSEINAYLAGVTKTLDTIGLECEVLHTIKK